MEQKRPVIIIALITALCLLGDSMLYVVLPTHWKEVGLTSLWEVGILLSVNRLVRLPIGPIVGAIYQRMSKRTGLLVAIILSVITTSSYGLISSFWIFVLMRCIWGIAWSFLKQGAYLSILEISTDRNRGHLTGTYNGLYRLGSLFGMVLGGIFADKVGIFVISSVFGAIALVAIPFLLFVPKGAQVIQKQEERLNILKMGREPDVAFTLITGLTLTMLFQGLFISILSHLIETRYVTILIMGFTLGAASLAGILQGIRWGWEPFLAPWFGKLSDGKGRRLVLSISLIVTALLFTMVPFQLSFWLWLSVLMGVQLSATVITTVVDSLALDVAKTSSKGVTTAYIVATDLGAAMGPTLGYTMMSAFGIQALYWGAAVLLIVFAIGWWRKSVRDKNIPSVASA